MSLHEAVPKVGLCDRRTKGIVFAYIKDIQRLLTADRGDESVWFTIPDGVRDLCLAFSLPWDCFEKCGKHIEISENGLTATNMKKYGVKKDTVYGVVDIDCDDQRDVLVKWTIRIHDNGDNLMSMGIDECNRHWINDFFDQNSMNCYCALRAHGGCFYHPKSIKEQKGDTDQNRKDARYLANDLIMIVFDVQGQSLLFKRIERKGQPTDTVLRKFKKIPIEGKSYCLAVYLWNQGSVTLENFSMEIPMKASHSKRL